MLTPQFLETYTLPHEGQNAMPYAFSFKNNGIVSIKTIQLYLLNYLQGQYSLRFHKTWQKEKEKHCERSF